MWRLVTTRGSGTMQVQALGGDGIWRDVDPVASHDHLDHDPWRDIERLNHEPINGPGPDALTESIRSVVSVSPESQAAIARLVQQRSPSPINEGVDFGAPNPCPRCYTGDYESQHTCGKGER